MVFPSPGDLPDLGFEARSTLCADSLLTELQRNPKAWLVRSEMWEPSILCWALHDISFEFRIRENNLEKTCK